LIDAAVATVAESGPAAVSLRGLAAAAGVSHAAPVHHFGDKAGLFTAIATEGFTELADELIAVWEGTADFLEVGVRYVHFALSRPGHFTVMFRADLLNKTDRDLRRAKARAFSMLTDPLTSMGHATNTQGLRSATLASWSIVHGLATLVLSGNVPGFDRNNPDDVARKVVAHCGWPNRERRGTIPGGRPRAR
jgi:AcrR family transcriptional regulator